jgi:hypothetical protein
MKEIKNKKSQLVFDMKTTRKLLKMNNEIKFCPFCGKSMAENCECHKNIIIDVKPYRNDEGIIESDRSVMVFDNNDTFKADFNQLIEDAKVKKAAETEFEQISLDLD